MKKYKCVQGFAIPIYDDDYFPTEKYMVIEKGTIWVKNNTSRISAEIELENNNTGEWLGISKNTLKEYFIEMEQENEEVEN